MLNIHSTSPSPLITHTSEMKTDTMYLDRMGEIVIKLGSHNEYVTIIKRRGDSGGSVCILKNVDDYLPFTLFTGTISNA